MHISERKPTSHGKLCCFCSETHWNRCFRNAPRFDLKIWSTQFSASNYSTSFASLLMKLQFSFLATACCLSNNVLDLACFVFQFYAIKLNGKRNHRGVQQKVECSSRLGSLWFNAYPVHKLCPNGNKKKKWNGHLLHKLTGTELH